jgi:benzoate/toluate 1,2-dioxygenase beta subunit
MSTHDENVDMKAVENFLYREAGFLDRPDLESWMALYTEDGTYWMPAMEDQPDPLNHVSHMYEDRVMMEIRRRNFVHPRASSKDSKVRSSHIIGNVQLQGKTGAGDLRVSSNFHVVMWYRDEQRVFAGTYEHHLQAHGDDFLIRHKKVELLNPDAPQKSTIIYL